LSGSLAVAQVQSTASPASLINHASLMLTIQRPFDLLLAAPFAARVDQLDPVGVHYREEGRVGQKVKCLFGTVAQQPLEPRPFG